MSKQKQSKQKRLFDVHGPFKVPITKGGNHGYIPINCPQFWTQDGMANYADKKGCYVFAIRAAKGYRPIYVGMTKATFQDECFTSHKIAQHYTPALADTGKGTPVMFLLVIDTKKGPANKKIIKNLETFLIQTGVAKNPELSNIQNRPEADWGIKGVLRGGKGNHNKDAETEFKKAMGFKKQH